MKKVLIFILTLALLFSIAPCALAASDEASDAADTLHALGLFNGTGTNADGTPNYDLDRAPSRNEAITMLVRLLGKEDEAQAGTWNIPFTDVAEWAKPYVGYAYANGLTSGTGDTTFGGDSTVTASQYLTFVLRALGYESGTDFQWDKAWELSDKLGITSGQYNANSKFLRGDAALVSESALTATEKGKSTTLLDALVASNAVSQRAASSYLSANPTFEMLKSPLFKIGGKYYSGIECIGIETANNGERNYYLKITEVPLILSILSNSGVSISDVSNGNPFLAGIIGPYYYGEGDEVKIGSSTLSLGDYGNYQAGNGKVYTSIKDSDWYFVYKTEKATFICPRSEIDTTDLEGNIISTIDGVKFRFSFYGYLVCINDLLQYLKIGGKFEEKFKVSQEEDGYVISVDYDINQTWESKTSQVVNIDLPKPPAKSTSTEFFHQGDQSMYSTSSICEVLDITYTNEDGKIELTFRLKNYSHTGARTYGTAAYFAIYDTSGNQIKRFSLSDEKVLLGEETTLTYDLYLSSGDYILRVQNRSYDYGSNNIPPWDEPEYTDVI